MLTHGKPEVVVIAEPEQDAQVTTGVGDNVMIWVETDDGRTPILYCVDRRRLTAEQFAELRAQAAEWTARLNAGPLHLI